MKSGQFITYHNQEYLFLGYTDCRSTWCIIADRHGNKTTIHITDLNK